MNENNAAQSILSAIEREDIFERHFSHDHPNGRDILDLMIDLESALLSKLRAPVADERTLRQALERIADPRNTHFAGDAQVVARAALASAPVAAPSDETLRLAGVIADKIEDGTLFQAGIFSRRELADKVRAVVRFVSAASAPVAGEREPWLPYLSDRADGVPGHYAIARWNPAGYREVWNLRKHAWGSFSDDVLTLEQAHGLLQKFAFAAPQASEAECSCPSGNGSLRHPCAVHPAGEAVRGYTLDEVFGPLEALEIARSALMEIADLSDVEADQRGVIVNQALTKIEKLTAAALSAQPGAQNDA